MPRRAHASILVLFIAGALAVAAWHWKEVLILAPSPTPGARTGAGAAADQEGVTVYASIPATVPEATLFAFDDVSIPFRQNLYVRLQRPRKHPANPVLKAGEKEQPDELHAEFYGSVIRHQGKFKMWYVAMDEGKRPRKGRPAYAESSDGIHWVKPNLGLVEYRGSRNNNLVLIEPFPMVGTHLIVLHEPEDPDPERRFKMTMEVKGTVGDRQINTSVPFYSSDGLRWRVALDTALQNGPVPTRDLVFPPESLEQSGLYKWQGMYYLTAHQVYPRVWLPDGQPTGRVMVVFRSSDFVHWSGTKALGFIRYGYRSTAVGEGEEAHMPASIWQRGNVLLGLYGMWHGAPRWEDLREDLGLLISNDGIHFREALPDFVFLPYGEDGTWDARGLLSGQAFENVGDQTYIWYGSWLISDYWASEDHRAIGLATLPRDRLGSLSTKFSPQTPQGDSALPAGFVTCALKTDRKAKLWINAEGLSPRGRLRVELLDELERPLPAYSGDHAAILERSGFRERLSWKGKGQIETPQRFRIKVSFEGPQREAIKFYALYVSG